MKGEILLLEWSLLMNTFTTKNEYIDNFLKEGGGGILLFKNMSSDKIDLKL